MHAPRQGLWSQSLPHTCLLFPRPYAWFGSFGWTAGMASTHTPMLTSCMSSKNLAVRNHSNCSSGRAISDVSLIASKDVLKKMCLIGAQIDPHWTTTMSGTFLDSKHEKEKEPNLSALTMLNTKPSAPTIHFNHYMWTPAEIPSVSLLFRHYMPKFCNKTKFYVTMGASDFGYVVEFPKKSWEVIRLLTDSWANTNYIRKSAQSICVTELDALHEIFSLKYLYVCDERSDAVLGCHAATGQHMTGLLWPAEPKKSCIVSKDHVDKRICHRSLPWWWQWICCCCCWWWWWWRRRCAPLSKWAPADMLLSS